MVQSPDWVVEEGDLFEDVMFFAENSFEMGVAGVTIRFAANSVSVSSGACKTFCVGGIPQPDD